MGGAGADLVVGVAPFTTDGDLDWDQETVAFDEGGRDPDPGLDVSVDHRQLRLADFSRVGRDGATGPAGRQTQTACRTSSVHSGLLLVYPIFL
jgi:hypothetical protein